MRHIKVEFFQCQWTGNVKLGELFQSIGAMKLSDRVKDIGDVPMRLEWHQSYRGKQLEAGFVRIEPGRIPLEIALEEAAKPLSLAPEKGLTEITGLFYDPETHVLLFYHPKSGVSIDRIARYLGSFGAKTLTIRPVIHPDALKKLQSMRSFRKIQVQFADFSPNLLTPKSDSFEGWRDMVGRIRAPIVKMELSMGRRQGSLDPDNGKSFINKVLDVFRDGTASVESFQITGSTEPGESSEFLDFIEQRMTAIGEVDLGSRRTMDFDALVQGLRGVWHQHEDYLRKMFPPEE